MTANNIQIFAWNSRTMEDHEKNCVVLNAKKPQNLFLWRYIENTCILLLGERSKPAKKNLNLKIFNLQYDAMGYTTYSFYHLHKNVPFRNGRNTSR